MVHSAHSVSVLTELRSVHSFRSPSTKERIEMSRADAILNDAQRKRVRNKRERTQEDKKRRIRRAEAWERFGDALQDGIFGGVPTFKHRTRAGMPRYQYRNRKKKTKLAELNTPIHVTERLLNHTSGTVSGIAGIYNRYTYLEEMRAAIASYESLLP